MALDEMTIREVLHVFSTFDLGGPEARFVSMVPKLGSGFHHTVLAMDGRYGAAKTLNAENVSLLRMPVRKGAGAPNFKAFRSYLKDTRPHQIVTYNFGAFEWIFSNVFLGIPHAHVEEGFGSDEAKKRFWRRNMTRRLGFFLSSAKLVTVSSVLELIAKQEWGVASKHLYLVPNGIDAKKFQIVRPRAAQSIFARIPEEVVIGTAARLRHEKRLDRLIEAFAALRATSGRNVSYRLVIAGDGVQLDSLVKLAKDLGIERDVLFLGHRTDLAIVFENLDVFALSSDTEQMPVSVLEAMASGLCVVATSVGDIPRMCSEPNQSLLANCTTESLTEKLVIATESESLRLQLGQANQDKVIQKFGAGDMVSNWARIYSNSFEHT